MHGDLRDRIDRAVRRHEAARKSLLREDGSPQFSLEQHAEMEGIAEKDFDAAMSGIESAIEGRVARAEEKLQLEEHGDPSAALTAEELEEANLRREFISAEVFGHTAEGLEDRVKAVISGGDRAALFLYGHFIRGRAQEGTTPEPERYKFEQLAGELEAALDPAAAGRRELAQAEIEELRKATEYAYARRHGAKDLVELHMRRAYGNAR